MTHGARLFLGLCIFLLHTPGAASQETKKYELRPDEVTLYGEIVDSKCYMEHLQDGGRGTAHRECAVKCAKSGIPLAFVEENTEAVYFLGRLNKLGSVNDMLIPFIADRVAITGKVVERGGARMIMIDMVERMDK